MKKRIFTMLLALTVAIFSLFSYVFAASHQHRWVVVSSSSGYVAINAARHVWRTVINYACAEPGCKETTTETEDSAMETHDFPSETMVEHYHEGEYHYYKYQTICTDCRYVKTRWEKVLCNGMEPIGPFSTGDESEEISFADCSTTKNMI